jgi:hypothetical protein
MKTQLYSIRAELPTYYHSGWRYKDVLVFFAKDGQRTKERFTDDYISGYYKDCHAEQSIAELFTLEEAQQVKHYLDSLKATYIIDKVELPVIAESLSFEKVYPDEFNSCCSYTIPGTIPLSVKGYCNVDTSMRNPESDDFKIIDTPELKDGECFFCKKKISEKPQTRIVVMLDGRTYGCLCEQCSARNTPELHRQLEIQVF